MLQPAQGFLPSDWGFCLLYSPSVLSGNHSQSRLRHPFSGGTAELASRLKGLWGRGCHYLGVWVVQVLTGTLVPGSIPVNAAVALCVQLPPDCSSQRGLFADSSLAIHIAHG